MISLIYLISLKEFTRKYIFIFNDKFNLFNKSQRIYKKIYFYLISLKEFSRKYIFKIDINISHIIRVICLKKILTILIL